MAKKSNIFFNSGGWIAVVSLTILLIVSNPSFFELSEGIELNIILIWLVYYIPSFFIGVIINNVLFKKKR